MTPEISDEWVPVSEDTPPIARGYKNVSRDVMVLSEGGQRLRHITITVGVPGVIQTIGLLRSLLSHGGTSNELL